MSSSSEIKNGSFKELWKISYPLMISFLSMFVMIFVDRIFLSYYSAGALNAAVSSGTLCWALVLLVTTLASLAEVYVAQYNGAKQYKKLGEPVWQMIWLGVISILFYVLLAAVCTKLIYGPSAAGNFEHSYFKTTMYFAPASVFLTALSSFYIGQGKAGIVKWLALLGNVINVILDPIMIFGVKGIFPSMGITGACIATGIGMTVQAVILFCMFFRKKNHERYGTNDWKFKKKPFFDCIRVGMPPALFIFLELIGWAIFYWMMGQISKEHLLISGISQSMILLFVFFGLGLEKGAAAVAGNLIGARKPEKVKNVIFSGLGITALFSIILCFFLMVQPEILLKWFFKNPAAFENSGISLSQESLLSMKSTLKACLVIAGIYMIVEYTRWLMSGILTAAGDTMFLMISGTISIWLFLLVPSYFWIMIPKRSVITATWIWPLYSVVAAVLSFYRFRQGKWKEKQLISQDDEEHETPSTHLEASEQ